MKNIFIKAKILFKDKRGLTASIELPIVITVAFAFMACFIALILFMQKNVVVDRFAHEMVLVASQQGKCKGAEIDKRYKELEESLGIFRNL